MKILKRVYYGYCALCSIRADRDQELPQPSHIIVFFAKTGYQSEFIAQFRQRKGFDRSVVNMNICEGKKKKLRDCGVQMTTFKQQIKYTDEET
jgi:hypothetical protein